MDDLGLSSKTLDLETVSVDDLIARVPDLGLLCAEDIVDWRNSNGKFPDESTLTGALGLAPTLAKRVLELGSAKPAWVAPGTPGAVSAVAPEPPKKAVSAEDAELAACLFGDDDPPAKAASAPVAPAAAAPTAEDAELAACLFGDDSSPAAPAPAPAQVKAAPSAEDAELDACLFGDEPVAKPIPIVPVVEPVAEGLGLVAESLRPRGPDPVVRYESEAIYEPTPSEAPFSMSSPPPEPEWPAPPAVIGARPPTVPKIDATLSGPFGVDDLDALIAEARGGDVPAPTRRLAPPPPIPDAAEEPVPHRPEQGSVSALEVAAPVVTKATSEPTLVAARFSPSAEITAPRAHHLDHPAALEDRVREVDVKAEVAAKAAAATPAKATKKSRFFLGVVVCVNAALIAGVIAVRTEGKRAQAPIVSLGADVAELRNDQLAAKAAAEEARAKLDETRAKIDEQSRLLKKSVERVASLEQRQRDAEKDAKDRAAKEAREIAVLASRVSGFEKRLEQPTSLGEALDVIDTVQGRPKPAPPVKPAAEPKEAKEPPKPASESSEHGHH